MRYLGRFILTLSTLMLAIGCKRNASPPVPTSAAANIALPSAVSAPLPKQDWTKLIIGEWVSSPELPKGGREDNCGTDYTFAFYPNGNYGVDSAGGSWEIRENRLTMTITEVETDDDPNAAQQAAIPTKRLPRAFVTHAQLLDIKGPVITATTDGKKEYWFKCSDKP